MPSRQPLACPRPGVRRTNDGVPHAGCLDASVQVDGYAVRVAGAMMGRMEALRIVRGDATAPRVDGPKIIAHVCNDVGGWGAGFVLAVSRRWPEPERAYRR